MMDLIKLHIYIIVVLVTMAHLSLQQEAIASTTAKSKSTVVITPAPTVKQTTGKSDNVSGGVVTSNTTASPAGTSSTQKVPDVSPDNNTQSTEQKTTSTVSPSKGLQNNSTVQPPQPSASTSSGSKDGSSTAAPKAGTNSTSAATTSVPTVKVTTTKVTQTQAPGSTTKEANQPTNNDTKVTVTPTTEKINNTNNHTSTSAQATTTVAPATTTVAPATTTVAPATKLNLTDATSPKSTNATEPPSVITKQTTAAPTSANNTENSTAAVTTASQNNTSNKVTTTTVPKTEAKTTKTDAQTTEGTKTAAPTTKTETPTSEPKTSKIVTNPPGVTTTQAPAGSRLIYINEIVVDKNGTFQKIELHLSNQFVVTHYAMVIVDGETNKYMAVVNLTGIVQQNGLLLINFNNTQSSPKVKDKGTGIAIYDTTQITMSEAWSGEVSGLMDALVIGKDYTLISQNLTQTLTPGVNPFVLDPNIYGQSRTISRCSSDCMRSTDMYALTNPSFGLENDVKCQERLSKFKTMSIKISGMDCKLLEDLDKPETSDELSVKAVLRKVAKEVNRHCRCGLTVMHIIRSYTTVKCCDGASIDMRFVASSERHLKELSDSYEIFLRNTKSININNKQYTLDSKCEGHCCQHHTVRPAGKSSDDKAKNVKVTVAVIVSCLVVFSIVVVIVILYMKKKNRAVYQFRMSRLDEEDDLYNDGPDHEDFVGGQEATFDVKYR